MTTGLSRWNEKLRGRSAAWHSSAAPIGRHGRWSRAPVYCALTLLAAVSGASEIDIDEAFGAGDWQAVAGRLDEQAASGEELPKQRWFQLGFSRYRLGQCEQALVALARARPDEGGHTVRAAMSDHWLNEVTLAGSPGFIRDQVHAWMEAGVKTPILVPSSARGNQLKAFEELFDAYDR